MAVIVVKVRYNSFPCTVQVKERFYVIEAIKCVILTDFCFHNEINIRTPRILDQRLANAVIQLANFTIMKVLKESQYVFLQFC